MTTLPTDSAERKEYPLFRGLLRYFPAALAGVARHSKRGNDKHNPGEEMHHARGKSSDHADCIVRHLVDIADLEAWLARADKRVTPAEFYAGRVAASLDEANALAWRALAYAQELHERFGGAPLAPGARIAGPLCNALDRYSAGTRCVLPAGHHGSHKGPLAPTAAP